MPITLPDDRDGAVELDLVFGAILLRKSSHLVNCSAYYCGIAQFGSNVNTIPV